MRVMNSTGSQIRCLIANPAAGKLRRSGGQLRRLSQMVQGRCQCFVSSGLDELEGISREIRALRASSVVIAGGDGTIMRCLSSLGRAYASDPLPPVMLMPLGTVNTTARRFGVLGDPWWLLDHHLADNGRLLRQPTLTVEVDSVPHIAATIGAGLVSHFFDEYESSPSRGIGTALRIFSKAFLGSLTGHSYARRILAAVPGRLIVKDHPNDLTAFTLVISSVFQNVGLGLRPTYRANVLPGSIHLVATDLDARRLGPQAWRVLLGKPLRALHLVDRVVEAFELRFESPTRIVLDGDSLHVQSVRVSQGPELLVWAPR